jgi:hypothetical protein
LPTCQPRSPPLRPVRRGLAPPRDKWDPKERKQEKPRRTVAPNCSQPSPDGSGATHIVCPPFPAGQVPMPRRRRIQDPAARALPAMRPICRPTTWAPVDDTGYDGSKRRTRAGVCPCTRDSNSPRHDISIRFHITSRWRKGRTLSYWPASLAMDPTNAPGGEKKHNLLGAKAPCMPVQALAAELLSRLRCTTWLAIHARFTRIMRLFPARAYANTHARPLVSPQQPGVGSDCCGPKPSAFLHAVTRSMKSNIWPAKVFRGPIPGVLLLILLSRGREPGSRAWRAM